jgi:hypothetical protein
MLAGGPAAPCHDGPVHSPDNTKYVCKHSSVAVSLVSSGPHAAFAGTLKCQHTASDNSDASVCKHSAAAATTAAAPCCVDDADAHSHQCRNHTHPLALRQQMPNIVNDQTAASMSSEHCQKLRRQQAQRGVQAEWWFRPAAAAAAACAGASRALTRAQLWSLPASLNHSTFAPLHHPTPLLLLQMNQLLLPQRTSGSRSPAAGSPALSYTSRAPPFFLCSMCCPCHGLHMHQVHFHPPVIRQQCRVQINLLQHCSNRAPVVSTAVRHVVLKTCTAHNTREQSPC